MKEMQGLEKLKNLECLTENVKIYVPSTYNEDGKVHFLSEEEHNFITSLIEKNFSKRFGGCTTHKTFGSYTMNDGKIVKERINIVQSYTSRITNKDVDFVIELALWILDDLNQESISIEINNKLFFIDKTLL